MTLSYVWPISGTSAILKSKYTILQAVTVSVLLKANKQSQSNEAAKGRSMSDPSLSERCQRGRYQ